MDCENCHQRLAQIHLTQIVNDSVNTLHLCEECAAEKGVQTGAGVVKFPLGDFIASMGKGAASALPADADVGHCESCESTLQDFREAVLRRVGIGTRVRMVFTAVGEGLSLPQWTLDEDAEQPKPWRYPRE